MGICGTKVKPLIKSVFIADAQGNVKQICLETYNPVESYPKFHEGEIKSMQTTSDHLLLFTCDLKGMISCTSIQSKKKLTTQLHGEGRMFSIAINGPNKYLITSDDKGKIGQWEILNYPKIFKVLENNGEIAPEFLKKITEEKQAHTGFILSISSCNKLLPNLFTSDDDGCQKHWIVSKDKLTLHKDFGKVHKNSILKVITTEDGKWAYTCDDTDANDGDDIDKPVKDTVKKWCVNTGVLVQSIERVHKAETFSFLSSKDSRFWFLCDMKGNMEQWSVGKSVQAEDVLVKIYPKLHDRGINCLEISYDNKYLFTGDCKGNVKQWTFDEKGLYLKMDFGFVHDDKITAIVT